MTASAYCYRINSYVHITILSYDIFSQYILKYLRNSYNFGNILVNVVVISYCLATKTKPLVLKIDHTCTWTCKLVTTKYPYDTPLPLPSLLYNHLAYFSLCRWHTSQLEGLPFLFPQTVTSFQWPTLHLLYPKGIWPIEKCVR